MFIVCGFAQMELLRLVDLQPCFVSGDLHLLRC
jgi:hypothetical protein